LRECKICAQPLAGLQLMRRDQSFGVAAPPPREPAERAFLLVNEHAFAPVLGLDRAAAGRDPSAWRGWGARRRNSAPPSGSPAAGPTSRYCSGVILYCVRKCRFNNLNFFPSSRQTMYSGVI
jgi:hypothetical protein